jgi:hypothetical protein
MMIGSDQRFFRVQEFRSSGVQEFRLGRSRELQGKRANLNVKR